ncbi:MAG TPA: hypothetical protein VFZ53_13065 [Polyangiaceae bacterium]
MRRPVCAVVIGLVTLLPAAALARTGVPTSEREAPPASEGRGREVAPVPERPRSSAARTAVRGSSADERRYAEKSRRSERASRFRAGDDVVIAIGATTLTIVLAIVLILVLL